MSAILSAAAPETVGLSSDGLARVDRYLAELVDGKVLPGAVTLVARHGKVIHRSAYGYKDLASGEALTQDTIFRIYSMTKPVTAVAMMILYDQNLWSPDDPIARHLPEFAAVKAPDGKAPDHAPTMRELMTHTAGFGYGIGPGPHDATDQAYIDAGVWQADDLADMTRRIASTPLAYQPGTRWRYSLSMDLQGAVIERLSSQSLPDFMRSNIFQPLGMIDTDFFVPDEKLSRLATVYHMYGVTELVVLDHPGFIRDPRAIPKLPSGGGGLFSTVDDYARFAQMLLNRGELGRVRIVSAASVEMMTANHLSDDLLNGGFVAGVHRMRPGYGYGFNGAVFHDPAKAGSPVGRGAYQWDGAAGTWFWIDPEHDLLYIGLIQRMLQEGMPPLQEKTQALIAEAMRI
jgi:CubicO group peptidase (beta-lactamase class C family)